MVMEEPQARNRGNEVLRHAAGCLRRAANAVIDAQGVRFCPDAEPTRRSPRELLDGIRQACEPEARAAIAADEAARLREQLERGERYTLIQLQRLAALDSIDLAEIVAAARYDVDSAERAIEEYEAVAAEARIEAGRSGGQHNDEALPPARGGQRAGGSAR